MAGQKNIERVTHAPSKKRSETFDFKTLGADNAFLCPDTRTSPKSMTSKELCKGHLERNRPRTRSARTSQPGRIPRGHRRTPADKGQTCRFCDPSRNPAHLVLCFPHVSWRPLSPQLHPRERPGGLHDLEMTIGIICPAFHIEKTLPEQRTWIK